MDYEEGHMLHEIERRLRAIDHKLDALVASNVTDPGILKALTEKLAASQTELEAAVKAATPATPTMPHAE